MTPPPTSVLLLVLIALGAATAFVPSMPRSITVAPHSSHVTLSPTRLHLWGGGKKKDAGSNPTAGKNKGTQTGAGQKKRATPMKYGQNTLVDKDEDVIVPATEYFANKKDVIVPILFAGLFVPIFGLLGWWLYGPQPEPQIASPDEKISYDVYFKDSNKIKSRKF